MHSSASAVSEHRRLPALSMSSSICSQQCPALCRSVPCQASSAARRLMADQQQQGLHKPHTAHSLQQHQRMPPQTARHSHRHQQRPAGQAAAQSLLAARLQMLRSLQGPCSGTNAVPSGALCPDAAGAEQQELGGQLHQSLGMLRACSLDPELQLVDPCCPEMPEPHRNTAVRSAVAACCAGTAFLAEQGAATAP